MTATSGINKNIYVIMWKDHVSSYIFIRILCTIEKNDSWALWWLSNCVCMFPYMDMYFNVCACADWLMMDTAYDSIY